MTLRSVILRAMKQEQVALFDKRPLKGMLPNCRATVPPAGHMTVAATLPAYHAYLSSGGYSQYTPDDFTADLRRFAQFTGSKTVGEIQTVDIQQYVAELKKVMPDKTVSRKVSAIGNYFRWLVAEGVVEPNPAQLIRAQRVTSPLPDLLYEDECERLLLAASTDPRTYLLILLLLETGLKKAELLQLETSHFDFSNRYQPELWVKHAGRQAFKDRRLKLSQQVKPVFDDYLQRYSVVGHLFPYTPRLLEQLLGDARRRAGITKRVTPGILRDMFVVRSVKRGGTLVEAFQRIGLSPESYDDARKKYGRLTSEAI